MEKIDLTQLSNDELIQLHQDGKISTLEFITNNDEFSKEFNDSCIFYNYTPTEEVAEQWYENHCNTFENHFGKDEEIDLAELIQ